MDIGNIIKIVRNNLNLTQSQLGAMIGVRGNTIHKYERGLVTNIPLEKLIKLENVLGVQLCDGTDKRLENFNTDIDILILRETVSRLESPFLKEKVRNILSDIK